MAMEQAINPPALAPRSFPRIAGGSTRSFAQSLLIAGLFISGLSIWLNPSQAPVLWAHLAAGGALVAMLAPWLWRHVGKGLGQSPRRAFRQSAWALLALWIGLIGSGLAMALPAVLWLGGRVWFPAREVGELLSWLHFWSSWPAMAGLILHLAQRHWLWGPQ